ncbi:CBS domain-containing protein [bacterium]|nr:CBS domain-containing protein [bacterium]
MTAAESAVSGGTLLLAIGGYLVAMLMAGLLSALQRVSVLHGNGLIEESRLGPVGRDYLRHMRRYQVTVGNLYLVATVLGAFACGQLLAQLWGGPLGARFHVLFALLVMLAWILGAILFKTMALGSTAGYVRVVGAMTWPVAVIMRPWVALLLIIMDRLDDTLWAAETQPLLSSGEIRSLIDDHEAEVDLDVDERRMIRSIFTFHDTVVREIMVPRIDMVGFEQTTPLGEVVEKVNECRHSRLPIYEGSVDRVVGVLYAKDLLDLVRDGRLDAGGRTLADLARPAYFVPESKKIDEVLDEFRAKKIHMAVVIDEYGGTAGIVTLEDVLEEIVGEIEDEFDDEAALYEWRDAHTLRVDPKISLEDLGDVIGRPISVDEEDTPETLGGLIYEAAGNVPEVGDTVAAGELTFEVLAVADQRITSALIRADEPLPGWPNHAVTGEDA